MAGKRIKHRKKNKKKRRDIETGSDWGARLVRISFGGRVERLLGPNLHAKGRNIEIFNFLWGQRICIKMETKSTDTNKSSRDAFPLSFFVQTH